jgi:hypothetical protein
LPTVLKPSLTSAPYSMVLIIVPSRLDPEQPFDLVVHCHGWYTKIAEQFRAPTETEACSNAIFYGLDDQMERARRPRILIAPQLNSDNGNPGKLLNPGAASALLEEVGDFLAGGVFKTSAGFQGNFAAAPVVVASYSGGYQAASCLVDSKSGAPRRVRAVLMLDSMYGKNSGGAFADWMASTQSKGIFVSLARRGTPGKDDTMQQSEHVLDAAGGPRQPIAAPPDALSLSPGNVRVFDVGGSDHLKLPVAGPPKSPLLWFLDALPAFATSLVG